MLLNAAADQIVAARGIAPADPVGLVGAIGRAVLAGLRKYTFTTGKHPRKAQAYALHSR